MTPGEPLEIVFPPHVQDAITCLLLAGLVASGLAIALIVEWLEAPKRKGRK